MQLGFLVDLHLCMGCKGCEIACKVENEVPLSTWRLRVKYVDVGAFPETKRTFTPLRCNHCANAPCERICPVSALHYIENGIVNIDKDRCIGCAGCVMACPYGAIYIDPQTQTADKCTYCAHRIASAMMPSCVVACPVEANIFGDLDDPMSNISKYIQEHQGDVQVRKPEKGTDPHHFYVGGGNVTLNPLASERVEGHNLFNKLTHLPVGRAPLMAHEIIAATHAVVTLDVALPGIVWGWIITMNMWAKSIGTGIVFVAFYLLKKYPEQTGFIRFPVIAISIVFIHLFLFFTVIDLHQMFRFWHIFFHPHMTSMITIGAWLATGFVGIILAMAYFIYLKKDEAMYDKLLGYAVVLAVPVTLYTAGLMAQSTARELWQMPTESIQMMLAAFLAGSASMILLGGNKFSDAVKKDLGMILGFSALTAFLMYMTELIFGPMKAEEVIATLEFVKGGEYTIMFWIGQFMAFLIPMALVCKSLKDKSYYLLKIAAVSALIGLWISKHVWLVIPQLLSMS